MPKVRPNGAARWASRTAAATQDYAAGVANPRIPWQQATVAAAEAHKTATTQALAEGRFAKGVQAAGDQKWSQAAQGKGAERFGPGAAAGVGDYQTGVAKYLGVIESTNLPPRGPKGDPRNIERVRVLAAALRKAKTGSASVMLLVLVAGVMLACAGLTGHLMGKVRKQDPPGGHDRIADGGKAGPKRAWMMLAGGIVSALAVLAGSGVALDTVTGSVTAPGATVTALTAATGDSFNVRNTPIANKPLILATWAKLQAAGIFQITHPSGHDQVRDIRMRVSSATPLNMFAPGYGEPVEPQETLALSLSGSAVGGQTEIASCLLYYPDLPGTAARLIDIGTFDSRTIQMVTVEDTVTATTAAVYSGARALNAGSDLLIANTDYAILGAHIPVLGATLTIKGSDLGNLRVGIPAINSRPDITAWWFYWLTEQFGLPLIPVINSANKAAIFIELVQDQALTAVPFSLLLAQLSPA